MIFDPRDRTDGESVESQPEPATISVTDVSLSFGDLSVLEEVSLTIETGEFVGLVGPNGAGKTTLLRAISGALEPDSGAVEIDKTDVHGVSSRESSRLVAVVPQDTSLSFSFPVRDVVEMGRHPHRSRFSPPDAADRVAVEDALDRTRTTDLADRPIDEVSGGQRQRVVLARAIAQGTPALVLDEPTASLDINHQVETLELVRELVEDGRTAVAAIHDLDLAARYCDRLVLLADGGVHAAGSPADVLTADDLAATFDANATVTTNPITGAETVTALPGSNDEFGERNGTAARVHVFGSGPTAASVLARFESAEINASLGPVARGDTAAEAARQLGVDTVEVDPFTALSQAERRAVTNVIENADVTVLADPVISSGNLSVLEALDGVESLVVADQRSLDERNAADESARERYDSYRRRGRETDPKAVLDAIAAVLGDGPSSSELRSVSTAERSQTESGTVSGSQSGLTARFLRR
ncbi:heme ABC transporter ATP-binding protein [Natrialbaceae archaeon A-arb3/5]